MSEIVTVFKVFDNGVVARVTQDKVQICGNVVVAANANSGMLGLRRDHLCFTAEDAVREHAEDLHSRLSLCLKQLKGRQDQAEHLQASIRRAAGLSEPYTPETKGDNDGM